MLEREGSCQEENVEDAEERERHHWDVVFKLGGRMGSIAWMEEELSLLSSNHVRLSSQ